MTRVYQPNFSGGILGESAFSRTDLTKYSIGVKDAVNMIIRPQGGASNRAGFGVATGFDTSEVGGKQRPIPFSFSTEQNYILEFAESIVRVVKDGAYVLDSSFTSKVIWGFWEVNTAYFSMPSAGEAATYAAGDLVYVGTADGHAINGSVLEVASVSSANIYVNAYDGIALDATSGDWGTMPVGAYLHKIYSFVSPYAIEDLADINFAQDADTLYLVHPSYEVRKVVRTDHDDWTLSTVTFAPSITAVDEGTATITGVTQADPAVVTTSAAHGLEDGDAVGLSAVVGMVEINDRVFVVRNKTATTFELEDRTGTSEDSTGHTAYGSAGTVAWPAAEAEDAGSGTTTYTYVVAPLATDTLEEGLPTTEFVATNDLSVSGNKNHLAWKAHAGAARYLIYKQDAGALGYIGSTTSTLFTDENITADTSDGPQLARDPFSGTDNYPSVVDLHEQRLLLMSTNNDPQLVEGSQSANLENFNQAYPLQDDDAFRFRLNAKQVNKIHSSVSAGVLLLMTSGGEWTVEGASDKGFLSPKASTFPRRQTQYGSHTTETLSVGQAILFVQSTGDIIRDFRPLTDKEPMDITVLSRDLFNDRTIVSWTYAQSRDSVVWVALDNGALLSMTYIPEHDIWAWTRHELGGTAGAIVDKYTIDEDSDIVGIGGSGALVHYVQALREGAIDVLYAVVERTLYGDRQVTTLERMGERIDSSPEAAVYLDASLSQTFGSATSTFSGLLHLRGQSISVVVDGDVYEDVAVDMAGSVDLGDADGAVIHAGLPYHALIETLDIDFGAVQQIGSTQGGYKAVADISAMVEKSRGVAFGMDIDLLNENKEWTETLVDGPLPLLTEVIKLPVEGDWELQGRVFVVQQHPMPMTITAVIPNWEIAG